MSRTYVYPKFSTLGILGFRTGGPGLGNLFFPYARALILAKEMGFTMINPSWATVKLGTFLRRERDKRMYLQVFKERGIAGFNKAFLLLTHKKVPELALMKGRPPVGSVVITSGLGNLFQDLSHEREYIADRFRDILRQDDIAKIRALGSIGIGVHVRMGDFQAHQRVPVSWYVKMISTIRQTAGWQVSVAVASDGSDEDLAELLRIPGVRRLKLGPVGEMFALAQSKLILASNSTFSGWAAFLGHVPIVWGKKDEHLNGIFEDGTFDQVVSEDEFLPSRLSEYIRKVFR